MEFGVNLYDSQARFQSNTGAFLSQDPLAEKYYGISPYSYCAGNPVNLVDPEGRDIWPDGEEELNIIRNTLPEDARQYVRLDSRGYIDKDYLAKYNGQSDNYASLLFIANSDVTTYVVLDDHFVFIDNKGTYGEASMLYTGVDDFFIDKDFNYTSGLTTGETGFLGKTLFPDRDGIQNSPTENIEVIINKHLSVVGAAEMLSHELYGHAFIYIESGYNHTKASHKTVNSVDMNYYLCDKIKRARKETIQNLFNK